MKANVEAIKHQDVRGKELLYLRITKEGVQEPITINIGQKTYDAIKKLDATLAQSKLPVDEPKADGNAMGNAKKVR